MPNCQYCKKSVKSKSGLVQHMKRCSKKPAKLVKSDEPTFPNVYNGTIHFVAGLPRSGSTLLVNILGQCPQHHVTPTGGFIELYVGVRKFWKQVQAFRAEGLSVVNPRITNVLEGMILYYYKQQLNEGKTVFDKSRGWLNFIEDVEQCLGRKIKILATVRDVRDIACSFELLYRNRGPEYEYGEGAYFVQNMTREGRLNGLFSPQGVCGISINQLVDARSRGVDDRLMIIPYDALTGAPKETLGVIHDWLEIDRYDYDFNNIEQITHEDDNYHGWDLHKIDPVVTPRPHHPWEEILGSKLQFQLDETFKGINELASIKASNKVQITQGPVVSPVEEDANKSD